MVLLALCGGRLTATVGYMETWNVCGHLRSCCQHFIDPDNKELSDEEREEALVLIKKISELNVSSETIKDMEDYKIEIEDEDGIFETMDLGYLRSLYNRLSSTSK